MRKHKAQILARGLTNNRETLEPFFWSVSRHLTHPWEKRKKHSFRSIILVEPVFLMNVNLVSLCTVIKERWQSNPCIYCNLGLSASKYLYWHTKKCVHTQKHSRVLKHYFTDSVTKPNRENLRLQFHSEQCNQHLFPRRFPLSPPSSLPQTGPPRWHDSLSHNQSLLFANAAALCASHSQQALQSYTAGGRYSSKHKHTWITQTGSCRELQFVCVVVCVCVCVPDRSDAGWSLALLGSIDVSTSELAHRGVID